MFCPLIVNASSLSEKINSLYTSGGSDVIVDNTNDKNLRFVGKNPNNYILFNNEKWRIIGLMNNVKDKNGTNKSFIKIVRANSIGEYSYDSSAESINNGAGVNEWSTSKIAQILNSGPYWNKQKGTCYNDKSLSSVECDFSGIGLNSDSKEMIETVEWPVGGTETDGGDNWFPSNLYNLERSTNTGKNCEFSEDCNDTIKRTTKWVGNIGILNGSDYAYATGSLNCLNYNTAAGHYDKVEENDRKWLLGSDLACVENDYLFDENGITLMTPTSYNGLEVKYATSILVINTTGYIGWMSKGAAFPCNIYPTLFLKNNIEVIGGDGTENNPYQIKLVNSNNIVNPKTSYIYYAIFIVLFLSGISIIILNNKQKISIN